MNEKEIKRTIGSQYSKLFAKLREDMKMRGMLGTDAHDYMEDSLRTSAKDYAAEVLHQNFTNKHNK